MHLEKLRGWQTDNEPSYIADNIINEHTARPGEAVRSPKRASRANDNRSPGDDGPTATAEVGNKAKRD